MADETLTEDGNGRNIIGAVTDDSSQEIRRGRIDDATKGLKVMIVGGSGSGTVTSVSVVSDNGFAGTVATATTTPAITLSTTITGILQGNGTAISAITIGSGLDFTGGTLSVTGGAGANTALSNLSSVAINTSLISDTDSTDSIGSTGVRWLKGWFDDMETTNMPTVGGTAILSSLTAPSFTTSVTVPQVFNADNAIAAVGNAATVTRAFRNNVVTNNSAATLTITMSTTSAAGGDMLVVQVLDASAVAQTITWVNTEDSTVTAPTTSNGSTTLPLTVGFKWNASTSKWRCIAKA